MTSHFPSQPVTTMTNVQSNRPFDHQVAAALNQNAQALIEVQAQLAALLVERNGAARLPLPDIPKVEPGHRLQGVVVGVSRDAPEPVDGVYDLSTITTGRGAETVAFKLSGVGPEQIMEPRRIKTLTVT